MIRKIAVALFLVLLSSCGTPEFQTELASCRATWTSKIPPVFEDKLVNVTETREVPTGKSTCTGTGTALTCVAEMRTEFYTVTEVQTVDIKEEERDIQIRQCTQRMCTKKYGNASCKV